MWFVPTVIVAFFAFAFVFKRFIPTPINNFVQAIMWITLILTAAAPFYITIIPFFTLRLINEKLYVRISCYSQKIYLNMWMMMIKCYMECRFKVYGEGINKDETHLWIANHVTHDWLIIYATNYFFGTTGNERVVIKDSVAHLPFLGWVMVMYYWPFLARNFKKDVVTLRWCFNAYRAAKVGLQVWLFPEGTRPVPDKLAESQKHARETGKPVWNNVMLPRHRGFCASVDALKGVATHMCDCTIAYDGFKDNRLAPFYEIFNWDHSSVHTVHIHVHKVALASIPDSEEERKEWLINSFQQKEERLDYYWRNDRAGFEGKLVTFDDLSGGRHSMLPVYGFAYLFAAWLFIPFANSVAWSVISGGFGLVMSFF